MRPTAETVYRKHSYDAPSCLTDALESVIPKSEPDVGNNDDAVTRLARRLCFEPAHFDDEVAPAFCEQLPFMLDHGVRKVALIKEVFADPDIQSLLPSWLEIRLFGQAALTADAGLVFVSEEEVRDVHHFGPKYGRDYHLHPWYSYEMAQAIIDPADAPSQFLAAFAARHHMIQASHQDGLDWSEVEHSLVNPDHVDIAVALEKPFDYFDDCFSRRHAGSGSYTAQAAVPHAKFTQSVGSLFTNNLGLTAAMDTQKVDFSLPSRIASKILEVVINTDKDSVGEVYRRLRPDLVLPTTASA